MNDMELNLIPLWELIIERTFLTHFKCLLTNDNTQRATQHNLFIQSLLQFVPTVSPFYYNAFKHNDDFSIELLIEALKHSMNSAAVENPKLYLEWSPKELVDSEKPVDKIEEVIFITKCIMYDYISFIICLGNDIFI